MCSLAAAVDYGTDTFPPAILDDAANAFRKNRSLYALRVADRNVLFRIDGVIAEISGTLFAFLEELGDLPVGERLAILANRHGDEPVAGAAAALIDLLTSGFLTSEPLPLPDPDPETDAGGIVLMVTQTCNLACAYCYGGGGSYGAANAHLPFEDARRAIDLMLERAPERRVFRITFFGGEPLLNFRLIRQVVDHCTGLAEERNLEFRYGLTTNGTIVNDEMIAFMRAHRVELLISYDGPGQKNRPFPNGRPSDSVVRRVMERYAAAGVPFHIRATLTRDMVTREALDALECVGKSLNRGIVASPATAARNKRLPDTSSLSVTEDEGPRLCDLYRQATEHDLADPDAQPRVLADSNRRIIDSLIAGHARGLGGCGACLNMASVSTDGAIYPCHRFVGMSEYAIGDLTGIDEARVRAFFDRYESANQPKCDDCFARLMCGGFCYYWQADGEGGFDAPHAAACERQRETYRFAIGAVLRLSLGNS